MKYGSLFGALTLGLLVCSSAGGSEIADRGVPVGHFVEILESQAALGVSRSEDSPARSTEGSKPMLISGWTLVGVGGATLVASIVTGAMALSKDKDISDNCTGGKCPPEYESPLEERDNMAMTTNILLAVGGGLAVTGIVLLAVSSPKKKKGKSIRMRGVAGPSAISLGIDLDF